MFLRPGQQSQGAFGLQFFDVDKGDSAGDMGGPPPSLHTSGHRADIQEQRRRLPIYQHREEILYLLETHATVILVGETGCGKTTQVPQYLDEAGWTERGRVVACTQPRRVAAMSVAHRVAEERGSPLGGHVGYCVRFEDVCDPDKVRIKYLTDGVMIREMMSDPLLSKYSVIMVDEAHERSQQTDLLLGLLKKVQKRRPDLRLIVSSATIDAEYFREYFTVEGAGGAEGRGGKGGGEAGPSGRPAVLSVEGRTYPVQVHYSVSPAPSYLDAAVDTAMKIHLDAPPGDILVFLTGQEECEEACRRAEADPRAGGGGKGGRGGRGGGGRGAVGGSGSPVLAVPLYAGLPKEMQLRVFEPAPHRHRKIVFSTNVAETSVTIPGVGYVVDCCFSKQRFFDPWSGLESLVTCPISKQSAAQRAGRAGRVRPGHCFRLSTEEDFASQLPDQTVPEMQRSELGGVVMQLKALGVDDLLSFDFLSPPPSQALVRALESLHALGALDSDAKLTKNLGPLLCDLPLSPQLGKALLASAALGCSQEVLTICAMLSVQSYWAGGGGGRGGAGNEAKDRFAVAEGDLITCLNVWRGWNEGGRRAQWAYDNFVHHKSMLRASFIRDQLASHLRRLRLPIKGGGGDVTLIRRALTCGLFANAAVLSESAPSGPDDTGASYRLVRESGSGGEAGGERPLLRIHPSSVLYRCKPKWVLFLSVQQASGRVYDMQELVTVEPDWLVELAPHYYAVQRINPDRGGPAVF